MRKDNNAIPKGGKKMKTNEMLKGLGVGVALGTAAALACSAMTDKSTMKCYKKKAAKCAKNLSCMLDSVQSML